MKLSKKTYASVIDMVRDHCGDDPEFVRAVEDRIREKERDQAVALLRRLVKSGYQETVCLWSESYHGCFYCGVNETDDRDWKKHHAEDCLFFAAKAFLASLEEPTDG